MLVAAGRTRRVTPQEEAIRTLGVRSARGSQEPAPLVLGPFRSVLLLGIVLVVSCAPIDEPVSVRLNGKAYNVTCVVKIDPASLTPEAIRTDGGTEGRVIATVSVDDAFAVRADGLCPGASAEWAMAFSPSLPHSRFTQIQQLIERGPG